MQDSQARVRDQSDLADLGKRPAMIFIFLSSIHLLFRSAEVSYEIIENQVEPIL